MRGLGVIRVRVANRKFGFNFGDSAQRVSRWGWLFADIF